MTVDLKRFSPEQAQAIIGAMRDGTLSKADVERLKKEVNLTDEEAEALRNGFSGKGSELEIGDFVLVNMGKTSDGKQLSKTKKQKSYFQHLKSSPEQKQKSSSNFFAPFVSAWKNNSGFQNVVKAEWKAATQVAKQYVNEKIKDAQVAMNKVNAEQNIFKKPFVAHSAAQEALIGGSGDGTSKSGSVSPIAVGLVALGLLIGSCSGGDYDDDDKTKTQDTVDKVVGGANVSVITILNVEVPIRVEVNMKDLKEMFQKMMNENNANFAAVLNSIAQLIHATDENGKDVKLSLEQLLQVAQSLLSNSKNMIDNQDKILEEIKGLRALLTDIDKTVNKIDANVTVNGKSVKAELEAILNAINEGNVSIAQIEAKMKEVEPLLKEVIVNQNKQITLQTDSNYTLDKIKEMLKKGGLSLDEIVKILNDIKSISADTNQVVKDIKGQIADLKADLRKLVTNSSYICTKVDNIAKTEEEQKALLEAILAAIKKLGASMEASFAALLTKCDKLSDVLAILNTINNNVKKGNETSEKYGKLILEAIQSGNVDIAQLVKLAKHIDEDQHTIIAKQDTTIGIANAILEWLKTHPSSGGSSKDYTAILNSMSKKLDDILAAIKDHDVHVTVDDLNITVDVTGKVTCECTCSDGHKHEGILGNLGIE